jgi:hypothetical protein
VGVDCSVRRGLIDDTTLWRGWSNEVSNVKMDSPSHLVGVVVVRNHDFVAQCNIVHVSEIDFPFDIRQQSSSSSLVTSELSGVYRAGKQKTKEEESSRHPLCPLRNQLVLSLTRFLNILSSPIRPFFFAGA